MKKLSLSIATLVLAGCVNTELSTNQAQYDAANQARIRLFGQNGRATVMEVNANGNTETVSVGGGMGQAFSSLVGLKGNESIGMPATQFSKNPAQFANIGSTPFFKEFIVPANAEITVNNSIRTPNHTFTDASTGKKTTAYSYCSGQKITFTAKAGKDYEVTPSASTQECGVTLYELN
ncbi:hypothetical protein [Moraxella cuniculi]|uniref:Lipoprotein n=1 Tax=Moraxella cuniculi TaxID=34061 RepID=A0A448GV81_9GAMM|nr:hypothetical protein [Moraxella cuniculi]VEG12608.1 Uncharacterised protein [Moraxella cuniculi]